MQLLAVTRCYSIHVVLHSATYALCNQNQLIIANYSVYVLADQSSFIGFYRDRPKIHDNTTQRTLTYRFLWWIRDRPFIKASHLSIGTQTTDYWRGYSFSACKVFPIF